ncbi:unnamed protein product [Linum trigynum]|uniref:Beta-fructofuranosidase n=1 Tax=Linum trigynum TaxID=586398 RepID=A0AAV2DS65_9ROSI
MASLNLFSFFALLFLSHGALQLQASHHHVYNRLQAEVSAAGSSSSKGQPYRTGYHFQPPKNWINGPMIYKGIYHLFYQYNPKGAVWGNIVWAHSTSTDLVNWTPRGYGIAPSHPSDINGAWSGSTTFLKDGTPAILYTGINPKNQQVQNLAVPKNMSDPYLRDWVKNPKNPLMAPTPQNGINASSFRDPTTAWMGRDKIWRVIIGSKVDRKGMAILYTSKDFVNWVRAGHPLHSTDGTGMWECPDFFPVLVGGYKSGLDTSKIGPKVKHALKVSLDDTKHDYYTIGNYDPVKDVYTPDHDGLADKDFGLRYDYGKYYASKTFFDSKMNRRILLGWVNESSSVADDIKKGWSGVHTIPRTIWLHKSGKQLVQWPVKEIEKLRGKPVVVPSQVLKGGSKLEVKGVTAVQADVEMYFGKFDLSKAEKLDPSWTDPQLICSRMGSSVGGKLGPFGLLVLGSKGLEEYTAVFYRIFKASDGKYVVLMCSDQSKSSLNNANDKTTYGTFLDIDPTKEILSLRTLIDHSIVESFGGFGKSCITSRVYPTLAIDGAAHLYAFNNGAQHVRIARLTAWSMKKAQIA